MVQRERFSVLVQRPFVACRDPGLIEDIEMGRSQTDPYLASRQPGRHRVVGLTDTDPRFVIDTAFELDHYIERLDCQRLEVGLFNTEVFPGR